MYEMLKELILHFKNIFFKKRTHPCSAKFCCLQEVEHGPLVLLHYKQLSVFQLCRLTLNSEISVNVSSKCWE